MIAPETAAAARAALWACIVELAEAEHDVAIAGQAHPESHHADSATKLALGLVALTNAAAFLAETAHE